ncbi:MAG: CPBP family intramembrane glutamic endopeptidase [Planctomycetota bacterium]|jgi:membrane protease YdiL (CAAX protease family)
MAKAKRNNKGKVKSQQSTSQLFNFSQDSYLERTSRPIAAAIFLLPFIVLYELGTFRINTDILNQSQVRVVAFVWLQELLESLGYGGKFAWAAPPLAVVVILIALQITSGKQWRFRPGDILPMAAECILLAVPLIVLTLCLSSWTAPQADEGRLENAAMETQSVLPSGGFAVAYGGPPQLAANGETNGLGGSLWANIVTGIGAGIYEELVFRLILICILMLLFQDILRLPYRNSIVLAVVISAALFSAHHHIDFRSGQPNDADPFNLTEFVFRTIAGVYFAALFAVRGFGITAGTHAFYNIIAVSVATRFFQ